jgi:hypothetical protein
MMKIKKIFTIGALTIIGACGGGSSSDKPTPAPLPTPVTNSAPIAVIDSAIAQNNAATTIDVLANDSDAENSPLSIISVTEQPAHGTTEIVDNNIIYTPTINYAGTDSLSYQISDGDLTANASVNITINHTLTLVGLVTDAPLASATVTATINEQTFTTTTDDLGNYQLPITLNDMDTPIVIQAVGSTVNNQANIELIKHVGSGQNLLSLLDEERNLTAGSNKTTNVTHLSTAAYLLAKDKNDNQVFNSDVAFQLELGELSGKNIINISGFIKLLIDNPEYNIPDGHSVLTLLDPADATISTSAAMTSYLTENNYINENGQATASYSDALANAISETITDPNVTMQFTTEMLAGNIFTEIEDSQEGWLTESGHGLLFNVDGTLTTYINAQATPTYSRAKNWRVSEGKLILTQEPDFSHILVHYPFDELTTNYGFDFSIQSLLMQGYRSGWLPNYFYIKVKKSNKTQKITPLNKNERSLQLNYTDEYDLELDLDDFSSMYSYRPQNWPEENPTSSIINSYQKTYAKATGSLLSNKNLNDIAGRWAMPFEHFVGLDYVEGDINGLYHDTIQINETTAVSDKSSHNFLPSLENGVLTLTEGSLTYKITPFKQSGKSYLAQVEKWQNNELVYIVADKIAQFDESYSLFTSNLVTELPIAQLSYIALSGVDAWQNNKLKVEQVYGYHFKSDGTLRRGIQTKTDGYNETYFQGDNSWTWSQNENLVELQGASDNRQRTWQVISVDADGKALVLESSTLDSDVNYDGEISDDEKARILIRPRINTIKQTDLSQWTNTWENSQF